MNSYHEQTDLLQFHSALVVQWSTWILDIDCDYILLTHVKKNFQKQKTHIKQSLNGTVATSPVYS
jgi:hypothetical protein